MNIDNQEIAKCVGLWLAEGDNKSKYEITFTNNQPELIVLFHNTLSKLFNPKNIRIYTYSTKHIKAKSPISNCRIREYKDERANKPYFIWRLGSKKLREEWENIINLIKNNPQEHINLLQGFFAGEGNIKTGSHNNRTLRIAQGKRIPLIENILFNLGINFKYEVRERSYVITGKENLDKFAKYKIADLNLIKKQRFWEVYNSFKEEHYQKNFLKNKIFELLNEPLSTKEIESNFKRSNSRIQEVLIDLKKEKKINNYRVGSKSYWVRNNKNIIIISKLKQTYLNLLKLYNKTQDLAKFLKVDHKSSYKRLKELENLGLVKRNINKGWIVLSTNKKVIIK